MTTKAIGPPLQHQLTQSLVRLYREKDFVNLEADYQQITIPNEDLIELLEFLLSAVEFYHETKHAKTHTEIS